MVKYLNFIFQIENNFINLFYMKIINKDNYELDFIYIEIFYFFLYLYRKRSVICKIWIQIDGGVYDNSR